MKSVVARISVFIIILFIPLSICAQSKGYLGRRLVVHSDFFLARNYENHFNNWNILVPRVQFAPGIEFALARKLSVGASLNLFKFGFDPSGTIEYMFQDTLPEKLYMTGIGLHLYFKTYLFKHSVAPYGLFMKFGFDWNALNINAISFGHFKDNLYATHFEVGYDLRIGNRFRLSWGTFFKVSNELFNIFYTKRPTILQTAQRKIFLDYLIGTKLAVGFLAI